MSRVIVLEESRGREGEVDQIEKVRGCQTSRTRVMSKMSVDSNYDWYTGAWTGKKLC